MQTLARHILVIWALAILLPSAKLVNETRSGEISSGEETALKSQIWYENQTDLWTYTKFLTARPLHDTYGVIETPDNPAWLTRWTPQA